MHQVPQPWDENQHGDLWMDDAYIYSVIAQHLEYSLIETIIANPPDLPLTYGHITFLPGYLEKLPDRMRSLSEARSSVYRAEARRLAYELWFWDQWWINQSPPQA